MILNENTTMDAFATKQLPSGRTVVPPDGSAVRVLQSLEGGGMAHSELGAGKTSMAATRRTVDEIWLVASGRCGIGPKQGARKKRSYWSPAFA